MAKKTTTGGEARIFAGNVEELDNDIEVLRSGYVYIREEYGTLPGELKQIPMRGIYIIIEGEVGCDWILVEECAPGDHKAQVNSLRSYTPGGRKEILEYISDALKFRQYYLLNAKSIFNDDHRLIGLVGDLFVKQEGGNLALRRRNKHGRKILNS